MKTWLTELKKGDFVLLVSEYKEKLTKKQRKNDPILRDMLDYHITKIKISDIRYKKSDNSLLYFRGSNGMTFSKTGKGKQQNEYTYYYLRELTEQTEKRYNNINNRNRVINLIELTNFDHLKTNQLIEIEKILKNKF